MIDTAERRRQTGDVTGCKSYEQEGCAANAVRSYWLWNLRFESIFSTRRCLPLAHNSHNDKTMMKDSTQSRAASAVMKMPTQSPSTIVIAILAICAAMTIPSTNAEEPPYATCQGCHCIPADGDDGCPTDSIPDTSSYTQSMVDNYRAIQLENPIQLSCNPFIAEGDAAASPCETDPPFPAGEVRDGKTGACVVEYSLGATIEESTYRLKTVASRDAAEQASQTVTHEGPCGACSSLQDLAVYISAVDLESAASTCGFRAVGNITDGIKCFAEDPIGFTEPCAAVWAYNTISTNQLCPMCVSHALSGDPNNDPATCELAPCIACDRDKPGPIFIKYAGRTRRNSGLLANIVRPCSDIVQLTHVDPMPPPTSAPTQDESGATLGQGGARGIASSSAFSAILIFAWTALPAFC